MNTSQTHVASMPSHFDDKHRRKTLDVVQHDDVLHALVHLRKVEAAMQLHGQALEHDRCLLLAREEHNLIVGKEG